MQLVPLALMHLCKGKCKFPVSTVFKVKELLALSRTDLAKFEAIDKTVHWEELVINVWSLL